MKSTDNITEGELFCCPACRKDLFTQFCLKAQMENGDPYWSHVEGALDEFCEKDHRVYLERVEPRAICNCDKNAGAIKYLQFKFVGGN